MATGKQGPANAFSRAVNEEIKALMARRGLTQTGLAGRISMSQPQVSKTIFRNEVPLNTNHVDEIAKALGDTPTEIFRRAERSLIASADPHAVSNPETDLELAAKKREARRHDVDEADYL